MIQITDDFRMAIAIMLRVIPIMLLVGSLVVIISSVHRKSIEVDDALVQGAATNETNITNNISGGNVTININQSPEKTNHVFVDEGDFKALSLLRWALFSFLLGTFTYNLKLRAEEGNVQWWLTIVSGGLCIAALVLPNLF